MNKILKIALIVIVIAGILGLAVKAVKNAKARNNAAPVAKIYPIVVKTMTPKYEKVTLTLPYLAEVENDKDVKLSSRIAARIINIKSSGFYVKQGEVIARLDTTEITGGFNTVNEQLKAAKITLENMEATHERTIELLKIKGASIEESQREQSSLADLKAKIASLEQKRIELQNNLSYATITSPVDGIVTKTYDNSGALSMPGKPLISISAKNGFYLMVRVPAKLKIQGVVLDEKRYEALVLGSTYHGLAEYKVYIQNHDLTSGDRVEVDVVVYDSKGTLLPFDALLNKEGKNYVLEVKGNKAVTKEVHLLQSAEQGIVIKETLEGSKIVVAKPDILLRLVSGYALKIEE